MTLSSTPFHRLLVVKVVDAYWDSETLGVPCEEVTVGTSDDLFRLRQWIHESRSAYQVVKLPVTRPDLMRLVENEGFAFAEAAISVMHRLQSIDLPPLLERINRETSINPLDSDAISLVTDRIRDGIFDTDRVSRNLHFSKEASGQRYARWVEDEVARGAKVFIFRWKQNDMGFFTFRTSEEGYCYSALSGLYAREATPGLGTILLRKTVQVGVEERQRALLSTISSNNPSVVRTHWMNGFEVTDIHYVYTKLKPSTGAL